MSTGTDIITDALQNIGAHSVASPAGPEAIVRGMDNLNSMLELWLSKGIQIGFTPLSVPGDELNEPPDARNGIVASLSIQMAPAFDNGMNVVSRELRAAANKGYADIKTLYQVLEVPDKVVSSTLPLGQGNSDWGGRVYFRRGSAVKN